MCTCNKVMGGAGLALRPSMNLSQCLASVVWGCPAPPTSPSPLMGSFAELLKDEDTEVATGRQGRLESFSPSFLPSLKPLSFP